MRELLDGSVLVKRNDADRGPSWAASGLQVVRVEGFPYLRSPWGFWTARTGSGGEGTDPPIGSMISALVSSIATKVLGWSLQPRELFTPFSN